ncbi:MAG: hypothetical protein KAV87_24640 [Desulfobacteraceae bacterium]|nr:hypothetical protein [Desulfobacteraceae bacterium]
MSASQPRFKDFLTSEQIADNFQITPALVMLWRERGLLSYRLGKRVWFYEPEVARFILEHLGQEVK